MKYRENPSLKVLSGDFRFISSNHIKYWKLMEKFFLETELKTNNPERCIKCGVVYET